MIKILLLMIMIIMIMNIKLIMIRLKTITNKQNNDKNHHQQNHRLSFSLKFHTSPPFHSFISLFGRPFYPHTAIIPLSLSVLLLSDHLKYILSIFSPNIYGFYPLKVLKFSLSENSLFQYSFV